MFSLNDALAGFPAVRRVTENLTSYPAAHEWVAHLPVLLPQLLDEWALTPVRPLTGGAMSVVFECRSPVGPAVLKLMIPGPQAAVETYAQQLAGGAAAAGVFRADVERGALLMEMLGAPLSTVRWGRERELTQVVSSLKQLWRTGPLDQAQLQSWVPWMGGLASSAVDMWESAGRPCSRRLLDDAVAAVGDVLAQDDPSRHVLLMGDVHAGNLLASADGTWKWIDLRGLYGPPEFDLSQTFTSWHGKGSPEYVSGHLQRRCRYFAGSCGVDADLLWRFVLPQMVLPGVWECDNGMADEGRRLLEVAAALPARLPTARPRQAPAPPRATSAAQPGPMHRARF